MNSPKRLRKMADQAEDASKQARRQAAMWRKMADRLERDQNREVREEVITSAGPRLVYPTTEAIVGRPAFIWDDQQRAYCPTDVAEALCPGCE